MRTPADISLDSAHAVFYRCRHVRQKTRESTRQTSTNLENPPKIDLKSTKIGPRDPPRALFSLPGTLPGRFFRHFFAPVASRDRFSEPPEGPGSDFGRFWVPRGTSRTDFGCPGELPGTPGPLRTPFLACPSCREAARIPFLPGSCQNSPFISGAPPPGS